MHAPSPLFPIYLLLYPSFRGMIDLLSYTAMDLHAARPVAGCRSSSQSLGVASRPLPSTSSQDPVITWNAVARFVALGGFRGARLYPSTAPFAGCGPWPAAAAVLEAARGIRGYPGNPGSPPLLHEPCTRSKVETHCCALWPMLAALPPGLAVLRVRRDPGVPQLVATAGDEVRCAGSCAERTDMSRLYLRTRAVLGEFLEPRGEQHTE